jgi:undecaprenyl-diphosphatase
MSSARYDLRFAGWLVALWGAVLALSIAAAGDELLPGDLWIARRAQSWDGPVTEAIAAYGNRIGYYSIGAAISLPVAIGLALLHRWREIALLASILLVRALNNPIKGLFDSPRPSSDLLRVTEDAHGLGYPSGHASGTMLLCGALILIGLRLRLPPWLMAGLWAAGLGTIVASGFGRVYAGVHWPSDVVGGWLFGLAVLFALSRILVLTPVYLNAAQRRSGATT